MKTPRRLTPVLRSFVLCLGALLLQGGGCAPPRYAKIIVLGQGTVSWQEDRSYLPHSVTSTGDQKIFLSEGAYLDPTLTATPAAGWKFAKWVETRGDDTPLPSEATTNPHTFKYKYIPSKTSPDSAEAALLTVAAVFVPDNVTGTCTVEIPVSKTDVNPGAGAVLVTTVNCTGSNRVTGVATDPYPSGITVSLMGSSVNIACAASVPPGTYDGNLVFSFADGSSQLIPHTIGVVVPAVMLTATPSSVVVSPGQSASTVISVMDTVGASGPVDVTISGLPTGVTAGPLTIPAGMISGSLVLTASASAPLTAGVSATVMGVQGALNTSLPLSVSVQPPPPGALDPTFGTQGVLTANVSAGSTDTANGAALMSGDKIVVVGSTKSADGGSAAYAALLTAAGSLDSSFGAAGFKSFTWGAGGDVANAVAVADGGILIAGATGGHEFGVAKLTAAGALDPAFGGSTPGLSTSAGHLSFAGATAVAVQPDGKIIAAGNANSGGQKIAVVRWLADGSGLDNTFNPSTGPGYTYVSFGMSSYANAVALQSDGKIVVAGYAGTASTSAQLGLARLNANGTPDTTFGTNGQLLTSINSSSVAIAYALVGQGTSFLAAGGLGSLGEKFLTVRVTSAGALDSTFGSSGSVATAVSMGSGDYSEAKAVTLQGDGKIVLGGFARVGTKQNVGLVRLSANGAPDTTFQGNNAVGTGAVQFPIGTSADRAQAVVLQSTGRIVAVGTSGYNATGSALFAAGVLP